MDIRVVALEYSFFKHKGALIIITKNVILYKKQYSQKYDLITKYVKFFLNYYFNINCFFFIM